GIPTPVCCRPGVHRPNIPWGFAIEAARPWRFARRLGADRMFPPELAAAAGGRKRSRTHSHGRKLLAAPAGDKGLSFIEPVMSRVGVLAHRRWPLKQTVGEHAHPTSA